MAQLFCVLSWFLPFILLIVHLILQHCKLCIYSSSFSVRHLLMWCANAMRADCYDLAGNEMLRTHPQHFTICRQVAYLVLLHTDTLIRGRGSLFCQRNN